jgi:2-hydroxychromene-2-carboxylate isomerase
MVGDRRHIGFIALPPSDEQPTFYYDLGSPYAWLAAERIHDVLPVVPVWRPILLGGIWQQTGGGSWARTDQRAEGMREVERRAERYGLLRLRWPDDWPSNTLKAMRAATFAEQTGRAVAFSLAAFRQAYAAGRDLGDPDTVLIAAAACEMHPAAVEKGAGLQSIRRRLDDATDAAGAAGVLEVPAVRIGDRVFHGDRELERAAAVLA